MMNEKASIQPFKPVENLLDKVINRYFSAKNRERGLDGYARLYVAYLNFYKKVEKHFKNFEQKMVENRIIEQPRKTYFMRDIETKIEVITPEVSKTLECTDVETSSLCVFEVSKMNRDDFAFIGKYKK